MPKSLWWCVVIACVWKWSSCAGDGGAQVFVPSLGLVRGDETSTLWTSRRVFRFRGLPYALPPTGSRRFLPPVPINGSIRGEVDGRHPPRMCPQSRAVAGLQSGNYSGDPEDCLLLNVFTLKVQCNESDLLPVMFYISGGGLYEGSAEEFPPGYLLEKDVVVVVPQYRLGPFGFLSLQTDGVPGNVGFLDQLEALRWTQRNARYFCGDQNRVTIFGQSAGALSVALIQASPLTEPGLFQRAIMQSGSALASWAFDDQPEVYAGKLADVLRGCRPGNASCVSRQDKADDEQVLRSASALDIVLAVQQLRSIQQTGGQSAVRQKAGLEKFLLPDTDLVHIPSDRLVPLIAGVTRNDGSFIACDFYDALSYAGMQDNSSFLSNKLVENVLQHAGVADPSGVVEEMSRKQFWAGQLDEANVTFGEAAAGLIDFAGALFLKGGVVRTARQASRSRRAPVWLYSLAFLGQCSRFGYGQPTEQYPFAGGVAHSNDLLFLWPYYCPPPIPERDEAVVHLMVNLWTSFATSGFPSSSAVDWPPIKPGSTGPYLQIGPNPRVADDFIRTEYHATVEDTSGRSGSINFRRSVLLEIIFMVFTSFRLVFST